MRSQRFLLTAMLSLGLAACTPAADQDAVPATSSGPAASTATPEPSATPRPTPEFPAPPELQGSWRAVFGGDDVATLVIRETGYEIRRLALANPKSTGRVEVDGDEIAFSNSTFCVGEGRYRWSMEGDSLQLESIVPDACPFRAGSLDGVEYTRAE